MSTAKTKKPPAPPATHYGTLGAAPGWDPDRLHRRYLDLAWELHPDRGGDPAAMAALTAAWSVLRDRARRAAHDEKLKLKGLLCPSCGGAGERAVVRGFRPAGAEACPACGGRGLRDA